MEKMITAIQMNLSLNAIKSAIISIAPLNLAVSFLILISYGFESFLGIELLDRATQTSLFGVYILVVSALVGAKIFEAIKVEKTGIDTNIGLLALVLLNVKLDIQQSVEWLPLVVMIQTLLISYWMVFVSKIRFKMGSVPPAVENTLNALIMPFLTVLTALIVGLSASTGFSLLGTSLMPLVAIMSTYVFLILTIVAILGIWVKGLHGIATVSSIMRPFWFLMMLLNGYAVVQGLEPKYIATESFMQWTVWLGGSGCTIGLTFALRYLSRSQTLKSLGKDSIVSNLFNINENIVFGVPLVDNPLFRIPFFAAPIVCGSIAYYAMHQAWVRVPSLVMPWVTPTPLGFFLATLFDFRALALGFVLIVVSFGIYYPFFKRYDKQMLEEESKH